MEKGLSVWTNQSQSYSNFFFLNGFSIKFSLVLFKLSSPHQSPQNYTDLIECVTFSQSILHHKWPATFGFLSLHKGNFLFKRFASACDNSQIKKKMCRVWVSSTPKSYAVGDNRGIAKVIPSVTTIVELQRFCHVWLESTTKRSLAKSTRAVEYTNSISAEGYDPLNECPGYDTKQSDGMTPVNQKLWGMQSTPSLPLLPSQLWFYVVAPDRALSMGWIEPFGI